MEMKGEKKKKKKRRRKEVFICLIIENVNEGRKKKST